MPRKLSQNPASVRSRKWARLNREKSRAAVRANYARRSSKQKQRDKARARASYRKHLVKRRAEARAYSKRMAKNPAHVARVRAWYQANKAELRLKAALRYHANKAERSAKARAYRQTTKGRAMCRSISTQRTAAVRLLKFLDFKWNGKQWVHT